MNEHRYILEPYQGMKSRYTCPNCQQKGVFVRYIDMQTGEHLHPTIGRCNRETKCGYHYTPRQYFQDNNISFGAYQPTSYQKKQVSVSPQKPSSFITVDLFKASLKHYEENNLVTYLVGLFGVEVTNDLISKYFLATSKHWNGASIFYQIDIKGRIRTGKIMLYNPTMGKRIKEPFNHITWVHSALKQPEFNFKQCLFGEHLLRDKTKPVALVESEKTAIIASVYFPQFIWLAVGGKGNLTAERLQVLKGRNVTLFPDLKAYENWNNIATKLSHLAKFTVFDLLERKASEAEKEQGFDLVDYLVRFDYRKFALPNPEPTPTAPPQNAWPFVKITSIEKNSKPTKPAAPKPETWEKEINQLQTYFDKALLPTQPVKLNPWETITDLPKFIESHIEMARANNGKPTYLPYLKRLRQLKEYITINCN